MICADFMHIHITRCGGSAVRRALSKFSQWEDGPEFFDDAAHRPLLMARAVLVEKDYSLDRCQSFTFVRNPFDWQISYWLSQLRAHYYSGTFRDCVLNYQAGLGAPTSLYYCYQYMGGDEIDHVGQLEHFERDFLRIMEAVAPSLPQEQIEAYLPIALMANGQPRYPALIEQHMREELYTPDLIEIVSERDGPILERWGYSFEEKYPVEVTK
jgi:hypothetical protein